MDQLGKPFPMFGVSEDGSHENDDFFKLLEADHDVELIAENILVAFEYTDTMRNKRWIKAVIPGPGHTNVSCYKKMSMMLRSTKRTGARSGRKIASKKSVYSLECVRLIPMFGKMKLGGEISHNSVHSFMRKGLIETFVEDITEEQKTDASESNTFKAKRKSIPINSVTEPWRREMSDHVILERKGPAQGVRVLSRGESKVCNFIKNLNLSFVVLD